MNEVSKNIRVLGIDPGKKRMGLATGSTEFKLATGYKTVAYDDGKSFMVILSEIIEEEDIELIVMGLPKNMDGSEGESANFSRQLAELIKEELKIEVAFVDERLSTSEAIKKLHQAGGKVGKSRGKIDMLSAAVILQNYFDGMD